MSCEAACRLILDSDNFDEFIVISEDNSPVEEVEFDATEERERLFKILKDSNSFTNLDSKIGLIYDYYDIYIDENKVKKVLSNLEYLDSTHKELFSNFKIMELQDKSIDKQLSRALAYFIYRHCSESCDCDELCLSLSFSLVCTHLLSSIANKENIYDMARIVSEEIEYSEDNIETIKNSFILDDETYDALLN